MHSLVKCWKCETLGRPGETCKGCQNPVSEYPPVESRRKKTSLGTFVPQVPAETDSVVSGQRPAKTNISVAHVRDANLELLAQIAENTKKTKHAVRAFVRFLFIQLTFTTIAVPVYNMAFAGTNTVACALAEKSCEPNTYLVVASGLLWLTGVYLSSQAGWSELRKSD